jgi:integrase/recombinase XerD
MESAFFSVFIDRPDLSGHLSTIHKPRKIPFLLCPDEMAGFLEAAPGIKYMSPMARGCESPRLPR